MADTNRESTRTERGQFAPGNEFAFKAGNPGRPKGSRNKLAEAFLADVLNEWESHGAVAISDMREKNPADFCKLVASIVPKENILSINSEIEMTDDELRERIRNLAAGIAPFLAGAGDAGEGAEAQAGSAQPPQLH